MNTVLENLIRNIQNTSILEYIAVVFGIISPYYSKKENILVYPTGIISVTIYIFLCFQQGIYAEMGIQIFYLIMSVYGWYVWSQPDKGSTKKQITRLTSKQIIINILITIFLFFILLYILRTIGSSVPILDALSTAIFITGMWLMSQKKIENWYAWIIGNSIAIPLFAMKGYGLTSLYYIIILIIAIFGLLSWKEKINEST